MDLAVYKAERQSVLLHLVFRSGLAMNSIGLIPRARTCSLAKFNNEAGYLPLLDVGEGVG